ncbi:MAG: hypothetical protein ABFS42_00775 [Candidatus Krumholzibacteriota bacterium]
MVVCALASRSLRCRGVWCWLVSLAWFWWVGQEAAAAPAGEDHSILTATAWTASVYSRQARGTICWLGGEDGSLRVEVAESPAESFDPAPRPDTNPLETLGSLLDRTGDGWTLILGPEDTGTLNAWGREWRQVPAGLAQLARLVTVSVRDYPHQRPDFSFAMFTASHGGGGGIPRPYFTAFGSTTDPGDDTWRFQLSSLELEDGGERPVTGFRGRMVARGRGTGGQGEVVSLGWFRPPGADRYGLEVTSSRRPGTLRLEPPLDMAVKTPEPEVFLPLWPLSQFLETR